MFQYSSSMICLVEYWISTDPSACDWDWSSWRKWSSNQIKYYKRQFSNWFLSIFRIRDLWC